MIGPVLSLRISRRAIGAAVLSDESFSFIDSRHLASNRSRAVPAAMRYLNSVLEQTQPRAVVIDAPTHPGSTSDQIVASLKQSVTVESVSLAELLTAFGWPALATRSELRRVMSTMVPQLTDRRGAASAYVLDAGSLAMYAEAMSSLRG